MTNWQTPLTALGYNKILPGFVRVETALVGKKPSEGPFQGDTPCCPQPHPDAQVHVKKLREVYHQNELLAWEWGLDGMGVLYLPEPFDGWVATVPARSGGWLHSYTGIGANGEVAANHLRADRFGQQVWGHGEVLVTVVVNHSSPPTGRMDGNKRADQAVSRSLSKGIFAAGGRAAARMGASTSLAAIGNAKCNTSLQKGPSGQEKGGLSLGFRQHGRCRFARIIDLRSPEAFLKHMIFHSGNNKQVRCSTMCPVSLTQRTDESTSLANVSPGPASAPHAKSGGHLQRSDEVDRQSRGAQEQLIGTLSSLSRPRLEKVARPRDAECRRTLSSYQKWNDLIF
eukprot:scaffold407_cov251-Pinguiococcus_pyrenoidosus.AAC.40